MTLGKIIDDGNLLLPQRWREPCTQDSVEAGNVLVTIAKKLHRHRPVMVLGEAGIGKSLTLFRLFTELARQHLANPDSAYLPVLVSLDAFATQDRKEELQTWSDAAKVRCLTDSVELEWGGVEKCLAERRLVLLLDAFDELPSAHDLSTVKQLMPLFQVNVPIVLTARTDYYNLYLYGSNLDWQFSDKIELLGMPYNARTDAFIERYCELTGNPSAEGIKDVLLHQHDAREACANPLVLHMAVDVIGGEIRSGHLASELVWTKSRLYQQYTKKWLQNEALKKDSKLRWDQKGYLVRLVARAMFFGGRASKSSLFGSGQELVITQYQLATLFSSDFIGGIAAATLYPSMRLSELIDEICFRTFLIQASDTEGSYRFIHKSFYEFYLAFDLWEHLKEIECELHLLQRVFERPLPDPVVFFFRDMLARSISNPSEARAISLNLLRVYRSAKENLSPTARAVRQHAGNFLPSIASTTEEAELLNELRNEPDQFVRRGIIVGLAMYRGRLDLMEDYIRQMRNDRSAQLVQLGYTRIYRGDQVYRDEWIDDGTPQCDHTMETLTLRAIVQVSFCKMAGGLSAL